MTTDVSLLCFPVDEVRIAWIRVVFSLLPVFTHCKNAVYIQMFFTVITKEQSEIWSVPYIRWLMICVLPLNEVP